MTRRRITLGHKHHTPTYLANDIPLDCMDITAYIIAHGYDNKYGHLIRHEASYSESQEEEYFLTAIKAGRKLSPDFPEVEFNDKLIEILRKFYPKRLDELIKQRNTRIRWDLPRFYSLQWAELKATADRISSEPSSEELRRLMM